MSDHQCLVFKPFLLDLRDERLWQGHEVIRIGAKAFAVLRCVLMQAGHLVTKDTLLETVWPETAVGEAVLTVVIRELRQALGDQAHKPQFIETVRGRGYRFIAPVTMAQKPSYEAREIHGPSQLPAIAPSGIFVGRETEVAQIHQWFTKALQGERQIGFIAGEPGIGKTALVDSFVAYLTATEHVWVGYGQCIDHYGVGEAYLPILEALARLCRGAEQLSFEDQAILEAASVAGMTFSMAAVAAAVDFAMSTIEARCAAWARQGWLVHDQGTETWPDGTVAACYGFRHALYHEVISARISPGQRIHLHYHIGNRKEHAYVDQTQGIAAELAVHFEQAREMQRAVSYRHKAAETALQRSAYTEAIAHLTQGLTLLTTLPDTLERAQHELALTLALGGPLAVTKGYAAPEVAQVYSQARELYQHLGTTAQLSPVAWRLWQFYIVRGELQTARELGEECLHLAGDDATALLVAHYALAISLFYLGEFAPTRLHAEQGTALYDAQHHHALASLYGYDPGMGCLSYAAQALWMLGYPDQAQQRCQEALALARQLSHPFSIAFGLGHRAVLHQFRREGHAVCEAAQELMTFCAEKGFSQWVDMGTILYGWGLAVQGQGDVGIAQMRQGLLSSQNAGTKLGQAPVLAQLAEVYWRTGQTAAGLQALTEALTVMDTTGERWWAAETYRLKGELLLQQGVLDASGAERCFQHAIDIARQQHAQSWELRAATSLARLWQDQGKRAEARKLLAPVYNWFTEGFDTADLQEAKAVLEELKG